MNFKINNRTWKIIEVTQEQLQKENGPIDGEYFGLTIPRIQEIWLLETLHKEQKRRTLMHELLHCYVFCYVTSNYLDFKEDDYCDLFANSHDIIHEIVEKYFKGD